LSIDGYEFVDTLKEKGHPVTIAASVTEDGPEERVLTQKEDWNRPMSIDYVFVFQKRSKIVSYDAQVEPFNVNGKAYRQLSDHLAVRCLVELAQ
jgi:endonuclease/exonuclease/phosphatase family metal-dependent hydrolase